MTQSMTRRAVWMHFGAAVLLVVALANLQARQAAVPEISIDPDDIGGVVEGARGPEAGVWVIAETDGLPTRFRKIVVTDDRGRFLVPDLPRAAYRVWVRGYGLVDSTPVEATPGVVVRLTAVPALTPQEAATIYPPNYWYSLLEIPAKTDFPGTGEHGNGIARNIHSQAEWISIVKVGCENCHQMGDVVTRTVAHLEGFASSAEAWDHRVQMGQRGAPMSNGVNAFGRARALRMFADWTDRIAAGEVPTAPPRPKGVERNLVLTMWDWAAPTSYIHDLVSTDKRSPTVNANGLVYGVDFGRDYLTILDPQEGEVTEIKVPVRENRNRRSWFPLEFSTPSAFWEDEVIWEAPAHPHNPMLDADGRVWITQQIRDADIPDFCKAGSDHPSATLFAFDSPFPGARHQLSVFDPKTQKFTLIDTCFGTHHLQFDNDADDTLYLSDVGAAGTIGWVNTRMLLETGDTVNSQGWCPTILDTNGDGLAGPFTTDPTRWGNGGGLLSEAERPLRRKVTPGMDLRIHPRNYGIAVNPVDHSVWTASPGSFPGLVIRYDPKTCLAEAYEPPFDNPQAPGENGAMPRGVDVDRNGVVWTGLAASGHTASFDRRKCKVLNGPTATGQHCPEGWTLYRSPGPQFKGASDGGSADYHYYNWVDQFNTLGLGENIPITNGSGSGSLIAVLPETGETVVLRVPYPVGFFTRGLDGRIDDPAAGWKGRGLWANNATNTLWHVEGGKGQRSTVVHFQLRPDPLAK